jgi:hypothetical protein
VRKSIVILGLLALLSVSGAFAAPITDLHNTFLGAGWRVSGFTCAPGASVACGTAGVTPYAGSLVFMPDDTDDVNPGPGDQWNTFNTSDAAGTDSTFLSFWITPSVNSLNRVFGMDFGVNTTGEFYTTFTLPEDVASVNIVGEWWVDGSSAGDGIDNGVCGIVLNSTCVNDVAMTKPASYAGPSGSGAAAGYLFHITTGFTGGANTLHFNVTNGSVET